jgi:tetratricopeptide (TPR) repeat protein
LENRHIGAKSLLEKAPFFAAAGGFALKAYLSQSSTGAIHHYAMLSGAERLCVPFYGMLFYLVKTILPLRLSALYGYASAGDSFMRALMYAAPFAALCLAAAVFFTRRNGRAAVFGSLFFLVTLLPVLQIVTIGDAVVAERYTYLPLIGVYFMAGAGIARLLATRLRNSPGGRAALLAAFGAIILVFAFMTNARCKVWKDSLTLWNNVLDQFPGLSVPHNMRGNEYRRTGRYEQALAEFGKAIACNPAAPEAYYNRGTVYNDNFGRYDLAIADFSASIRLNPGSAASYNNRGTAYLAKGIIDTALENFSRAVSLKPDYAEAYVNRGLAQYRLRRYEDAVAEFGRALRLDAGLVEAYNSRGASRAAEGDFDGAAVDFRKALELRPDYPEAKRNLALALKRLNPH